MAAGSWQSEDDAFAFQSGGAVEVPRVHIGIVISLKTK